MVVALYMIIIPFFETPYWCIHSNGSGPDTIQESLLYKCSADIDLADYAVAYT